MFPIVVGSKSSNFCLIFAAAYVDFNPPFRRPYRYRYGRGKGGLKSTYAAAKMRQKFHDFEPTTIGNIAEDMFMPYFSTNTK